MPKEGDTRRAKLSYEVFNGKGWSKKFKSINPFKKRGGTPLGEWKVWSLTEETVKRIMGKNDK